MKLWVLLLREHVRVVADMSWLDLENVWPGWSSFLFSGDKIHSSLQPQRVHAICFRIVWIKRLI